MAILNVVYLALRRKLWKTSLNNVIHMSDGKDADDQTPRHKSRIYYVYEKCKNVALVQYSADISNDGGFKAI